MTFCGGRTGVGRRAGEFDWLLAAGAVWRMLDGRLGIDWGAG
jgi:hypothetical protein